VTIPFFLGNTLSGTSIPHKTRWQPAQVDCLRLRFCAERVRRRTSRPSVRPRTPPELHAIAAIAAVPRRSQDRCYRLGRGALQIAPERDGATLPGSKGATQKIRLPNCRVVRQNSHSDSVHISLGLPMPHRWKNTMMSANSPIAAGRVVNERQATLVYGGLRKMVASRHGW
jgi:hypothetical protein